MKIDLVIIGFIIIIIVIFQFDRWHRVAAGIDVRNITPKEVKARLDSGEKAFLVDVRTPEEYAEKHIPGSILLPLDQLEQEVTKKIPDITAPIFIYCRSGRRSAKGAAILVKLGYRNVYDMGAMMNWFDDNET